MNNNGDHIDANISGPVEGQVAIGRGNVQTQTVPEHEPSGGGGKPAEPEGMVARISGFFDSTAKIAVAATAAVVAVGGLVAAIVNLVH